MIESVNKNNSNIINTKVSIKIEEFTLSKKSITKNKEEKISDNEIKKTLDDLNNILLLKNDLRFGYNIENNIPLIEIFNIKTDKLIRQFPTEDFFKRIKYFKEEILPGLIMDEQT